MMATNPRGGIMAKTCQSKPALVGNVIEQVDACILEHSLASTEEEGIVEVAGGAEAKCRVHGASATPPNQRL